MRAIAFGPVLCLLFAMAAGQAEEGDEPAPRKEYPEDYHPALKDIRKDVPGLLIYGPDALECVRFEPDGLRITLPADYPRQRSGTGVVTAFGVKGDFEITVSFEVLPGSRQGDWGNPTDLRLVVVPNEPIEPEVWHKASQNRAGLARELGGPHKGDQFLADVTKWQPVLPKDKWGNEVFANIERHTKQRSPATAPAGRLRLVRSGSVLSFYTSEDAGKDFALLHKDELGTKDLKNVRVLGSTGGPGAILDVRVTDLRIRADAFPKVNEALPQPAAGTLGTRWSVILLAGGVPVALAFSLGAWLYARRRRHVARAGPAQGAGTGGQSGGIAFSCASCGKRLKARSEQAGCRLKCPQCGKAVDVPNSEPTSPEELP